jgi:hypothetical protein
MAALTKRATLTRAEAEFGFYAVPSAVVEEARLKGKVPTTISVVRAAPRSDGDQQVCAQGGGVKLNLWPGLHLADPVLVLFCSLRHCHCRARHPRPRAARRR